MPGVYISYPFCAQKCTYCNFASGVMRNTLAADYLTALASEVDGHEWAWTPETVYLGGGTPSQIEASDFLRVLGRIPAKPWREATIEVAPGNLHITTKLNGTIVQDANTSQFIWDEENLVHFITSRLTLYPGDVISTGTPAGTGMERQKFLKPGDVITIEIEGIGTLTTPFMSLSQKPATQ